MSRYSSHLCPPALVVACSCCHDIFSCLFLEFCCDIILQYGDIILLKLSSLCRDMSVLCRDIKTLLQHNLSFFAASEFYRDIDFFVVTKLLAFQPCFMLHHKFEMSQHKVHCLDSLLLSPLHLFVTTEISASSSSSLLQHSFLMLRYTFCGSSQSLSRQ